MGNFTQKQKMGITLVSQPVYFLYDRQAEGRMYEFILRKVMDPGT